MRNEYFHKEYIPQIIKYGKITCWAGIIMILLPVIAVTVLYGVMPDKEQLTVALIGQITVNAAWWFIEPISYFAILGIPGTYVSFLAGNGGNLRMPCAAAAQRAAGVTPGTDQGAIISTIGICCSVFVNILMLTIAIILGSSILSRLPENITSTLQLLLPALFGAVFAQFAIEDIFCGVVSIIIAVGAYLMYNAGWFNWIPLDPSIGTILLPIFGTLLAAKWYYSRIYEKKSAQ